MSVLIFSHFERPSLAANMTVEELVRGRKASDGRTVILIYDHKTGAQGPAQVALEHKLFDLFAKRSVTVHYHQQHFSNQKAPQGACGYHRQHARLR